MGPHGAAADGPLSIEEKRQLLAQFGSRAVHDIAGPIDQVSSLIALFVRRYQNKIDAESDAEIRAGSLPHIVGDAELLTLLFQTLLDNSLKFRRSGVRPSIDVSAQ